MTQTFKRTGTHRPRVICNVFLNKLKPIWTILASDEEGVCEAESAFLGPKYA
jgi:hypothetical protein